MSNVEVTARSIFGKRKGRVFDARLEDYRATKPTRKEAIAAVLADKAYCENARSVAGHGCALYAQGVGEWCFVLPSGGSMCFGAVDFASALARVQSDYSDHEGCQAFFTTMKRETP